MEILERTLSTTYLPEKRKEMRAFNGKILHVNLSDGNLWVEEPDENFYRKYIGGRGVGLYYLLTQMPARVDPLGPENVLVFSSGILTGTVLPGTGRHGVAAKSPLTGALASSEAGGWWGSELKKAGFDAIVIRGRAPFPVYLWIKDGAVALRDARHLWGKPTGETETAIRTELGDEKIQTCQIGPAGENLVRYACITSNVSRAAGRSGLGAVMGSKNLKAIAVRGSTNLGLADTKLMQLTAKWIISSYKTAMDWAVEAGTSGSVKFLHDIGSTPNHNYQDSSFAQIANLDAEHFFPILLQGRDTCNHCSVRCKIVVAYGDGEIKIDPQYGGPEYESIGGLGPLCMIGDPVVVAKANELCAAYGLDTISAGGTIAFTMECVEKGLLKPKEGEFLPVFGSGADLLESIHRIVYRRDIGNLMAEGSLRMARSIGAEAVDLTATTRGQEMPLHDPRFRNATGLGYALSPTGADHMHNINDFHANNPGSDTCARLSEIGLKAPLPLFGLPEEKIAALASEVSFKNFADSAVYCQFYPYEYKHMVDALRAATGWEVTLDEIVQIGRRITTMARLFLVREGFTAEEDRLPVKMYTAHADGPIAGKALSPELVQSAVQTFYHWMGWDESGVPTQETLLQLELDWNESRRLP